MSDLLLFLGRIKISFVYLIYIRLMLKFTDSTISSLVGDRTPLFGKPIFVTISPNPKTKHICLRHKKSNIKLPYGKLPQEVQYEYCIRILKQCYLQLLSGSYTVYGTWELNQDNNVHLHFLIDSEKIQTDYDLNIFRRDILCCPLVFMNLNKLKSHDYMNNIVFLNKPFEDIIEYMDKDNDQKINLSSVYEHSFKNYYFENIL
jgi:hypothetical protein